ncbi:MAG: hypothetical protein LBP33_09640 [Candidatus Adiutrix sp.]|jgi:hypothetical protein|nr:hypothetical protein [Candidatus Adiutrix sp.]
MTEEKKGPPRPEPAPAENFDRQAYLREVRMEILRNLGLPEDSSPEQVRRLLEIKKGH